MRRFSSWSSTTRIRLLIGAATCRSTRTGSANRKVEPRPRADSTQIRPPCISTIRLAMARPSPVPPFFRVLELSACWNSSKILAWSASEIPGPVSATETTKLPSETVTCHPDLAGLGELEGVADEVQEHLGDPPLVAPAGRQVGRHGHAQRELLLGGERLHARRHGLRDLLHGVVGEGQRELAGLDLGEVEDVVDEAEEVLAAVPSRARDCPGSARARRRRSRRGSAPCSRGWR